MKPLMLPVLCLLLSGMAQAHPAGAPGAAHGGGPRADRSPERGLERAPGRAHDRVHDRGFDRQQLRGELRSASLSRPLDVGPPANEVGPPRHLSARERAELREQIRRESLGLRPTPP